VPLCRCLQEPHINESRVAELLTIAVTQSSLAPEFEYHREALVKAALFGVLARVPHPDYMFMNEAFVVEHATAMERILKQYKDGIHTNLGTKGLIPGNALRFINIADMAAPLPDGIHNGLVHSIQGAAKAIGGMSGAGLVYNALVLLKGRVEAAILEYNTRTANRLADLACHVPAVEEPREQQEATSSSPDECRNLDESRGFGLFDPEADVVYASLEFEVAAP